MFWCLLTCCVLLSVVMGCVDFLLVLWVDFIWSFLGHYRPLRHMFWTSFWTFFCETIFLKLFFWNYPKLSETNSNFLKLFFWNCPKLSESKSAKIIFWWQFSDLVVRQNFFFQLYQDSQYDACRFGKNGRRKHVTNDCQNVKISFKWPFLRPSGHHAISCRCI
jgi:hypothetical protein